MNHLHNTIIHGCSKEMLRTLPDNSIGSIVTDPPYELGFMGKKWDNTGIAYDVELWQECLRVLKPGGHILAFSSTRTYHRMATAIEDAGFEIRDNIAWVYSKSTAFADLFNSLNTQQQKLLEKVMNDDAMLHWSYGSGFPKSLNIGKAVDKLQGNERENLGKGVPTGSAGNVMRKGMKADYNITKGNSEWEGWGTALKPAHEPICMARKPLSEKSVAENVLKHRTGGINIDGSRVGTEGGTKGSEFFPESNTVTAYGNGHNGNKKTIQIQKGRFPANLIHDNSEYVIQCFPHTKSGKMTSQHVRHTNGSPNGIYGKFDVNHPLTATICDEGSAARFFKAIIYQPKAAKAERGTTNNHPTVKPIALIQYLVNLVTPPNTISLDPFSGSGTHALACINLNIPYIEIEKELEHINIINERIKNHTPPTPTLF